MKVAFVSNWHGQCGVTTASLLTASFLAVSAKRNTCFLQFSSNGNDVKEYLGLEDEEKDITRSASQLYKLLDVNAISHDEIKAYAIPTVENLDLFNINTATLEQSMVTEIQKFLIDRMPYNYVIMDVSGDPGLPSNKMSLELADYVVIVVNQNRIVLKSMRQLLEKYKLISDRLIIMINNYDPTVIPLTKLIKEYVLPRRNTFLMHRNPRIQRFMSQGNMLELMNHVSKRETLVADVFEDVKKVIRHLQLQGGDFADLEV